jgi:hypothetical protein
MVQIHLYMPTEASGYLRESTDADMLNDKLLHD